MDIPVRLRFLTALCVFVCCSLQAQTFRNPVRIATAGDPKTVLAGDLNGDGIPDLLYATADTPVVLHALLADGRGGYRPGQDVILPASLSAVCKLADVTGDGKLDALCTGLYPSTVVAVLPGNGDGTFGAPIVSSLPSAAGAASLFVATVADLNHDGQADVIVSDGGLSLYPMLGDGAGNFTPTASAAADVYVSQVLVTDLNGDGFPDLVVQASSLNTAVLFGHGDGTFTQPVQYTGSYGAALADVDGDGHLDLVGGGDGILKIFHGNADGSFSSTPIATVDYSDDQYDGSGLGTYSLPLACLDLNGDGIPDVLAYGYDGLTVILGQPGLTFGVPQHFAVGESIFEGLLSGGSLLLDMNGDGHPDFVSAGPSGIYIDYGRADGSFASADTYESGRNVSSVAVADFNEDGTPDVVTSGDTQLYLSLGKPDGTFGAANALGTQWAPRFSRDEGYTFVTHGDVNGDGHQDLVALGSPDGVSGGMYVLLGHGDGTFGTAAQVDTTVPFTTLAGVLDLNGDGRDDIAVLSPNTLTVYLSGTNGTFQPVTTTLSSPSGEYAGESVSLKDVNGDGLPDLVYTTSAHLAVAAGRGDGSFAAPAFYPVPQIASAYDQQLLATAVGDFDGDGAPDIAVMVQFERHYADLGPTQIFMFYHQGPAATLDGNSFAAAVPGPVSIRSFAALYAADLNGDGVSDLIAEGPEYLPYPDALGVFNGRTDRTLGAEMDFVSGIGVGSLGIADLNHDGRPDLVKSNNPGNSFTVLLSEGGSLATGTLTASPHPVLVGGSFTLTAQVSVAGSNAVLGGTVTFAVDGNALGTATLSGGVATIAGPLTLALGTHQLTAVSSALTDGETSYPAVHLGGTEVVAALPVVVSLTVTPNPATTGQSSSLAVSVVNASGAPASAGVPSGGVTLSANGNSVGTVTAQGIAGPATLSYTFPSAGLYTVTANYAGDATHAAASASVTVQVNVAAAASAFTLALAPAVVHVTPGQDVAVVTNLTSVGGYAGSLTLGVGTMPAGLSGSFSTGSVPLNAGGEGRATLTISAGQSTAGLRTPLGSWPFTEGGMAGVVTLACLVPLSSRKRRRWAGLGMGALAGMMLLSLGGCGQIVDPLVTAIAVAAGTYQIPVTATDAVSHQAQTAILTVVVSSSSVFPRAPKK